MPKGLGQRQHAEMLNWTFGKVPATTPSGVIYLAAWEGDPGADGQSGTEANGVNAAAILSGPADWNVATTAVPAVTDNLSLFSFPQAGAGGWNGGNALTHVGLWKHLTNRAQADYVGRGLLGTPRIILEGVTLTIPIGNLTVTINETA